MLAAILDWDKYKFGKSVAELRLSDGFQSHVTAHLNPASALTDSAIHTAVIYYYSQ